MVSSIEVRPITVQTLRELASGLLAEHWAEAARGGRGAAPDWDRYKLMEAHGYMVVLGAWDGDQFAGYSAGILGKSGTGADTPALHNEALYCSPVHRSAGVGLALMRATEKAARERLGESCEVVVNAPVGSRVEYLLGHMDGYEHRESVFVKGVI